MEISDLDIKASNAILKRYWDEIRQSGLVPPNSLDNPRYCDPLLRDWPIHYGITEPAIYSPRNIDTLEGKPGLHPIRILVSNEGLYCQIEYQTSWSRYGSIKDMVFEETEDGNGKVLVTVIDRATSGIIYKYFRQYDRFMDRKV